MKTLQFTEKLIKGKIAEIIFEMMFRQSGYRITHFGYEYTAGEFIREDIQQVDDNKTVLDEIRHSPDFIVTTPKNHVHFVEVKFQSELRPELLLKMATKTYQRWSHAWYFVATKQGFFFSPCERIVNTSDGIQPLSPDLIPQDIQTEYISVLNNFVHEPSNH